MIGEGVSVSGDEAVIYVFLIWTPVLFLASWVLEILVDRPSKEFAGELDRLGNPEGYAQVQHPFSTLKLARWRSQTRGNSILALHSADASSISHLAHLAHLVFHCLAPAIGRLYRDLQCQKCQPYLQTKPLVHNYHENGSEKLG